MIVQVSTDAGTSWQTIDTVTQTDGWEMKIYRILDHVPLTSGFRVRVQTSDFPEEAIVEAAIDRFRIEDLSCVPCSQLPDQGGMSHEQYFQLLSRWVAGDPLADFNSDGILDIFDILTLFNVPSSNCP